MSHTPEPWRINPKYSMSVEAVSDGQGINIIAECSDPDGIRTAGEDVANARRIVACVNAAAGIPTEQLEARSVQAGFVTNLLNQRDELLAALKRMNSAYVILMASGRDRILDLGGRCDGLDVMERNDINLRESRAAIAKAEARK